MVRDGTRAPPHHEDLDYFLHRGRARGLPLTENSLITGEKRIDRVTDHLLLAFEHRRLVDEFADAMIENSAVKYPGHFQFGGARLVLSRQSHLMAALANNARQDLVPDDSDIGAVEVQTLETGIEIDADPFAVENHLGIGVVEFPQTFPHRPRPVRKQFLP